MTDKKTTASPGAGATGDAPVSVTGLLAALNDNFADFTATQNKLIARATSEATKAGEEFAKLSLRPDAGEFEALKKRAEKLELDLSTAKLQLKEAGKELELAVAGVRESQEARRLAESHLDEARSTITSLQSAAAADQRLILSMRARTEALSAHFEAARNALSLPDLDELPGASAPDAEMPTAQEPAVTDLALAADFGLTDPAPEKYDFADPDTVTAFTDPPRAEEEDDPFKPVRSIGTFRPASLPDSGFNPPAPDEEPAAKDAPAEDAEPAEVTAAEGADLPDLEDDAPAADAAPAGFDLPELELPELELPEAAPGDGLELPELELPDLELPAPEEKPVAGLNLPGLDDLALPDLPAPAATGFGLLELPDLEPAPAH